MKNSLPFMQAEIMTGLLLTRAFSIFTGIKTRQDNKGA